MGDFYVWACSQDKYSIMVFRPSSLHHTYSDILDPLKRRSFIHSFTIFFVFPLVILIVKFKLGEVLKSFIISVKFMVSFHFIYNMIAETKWLQPAVYRRFHVYVYGAVLARYGVLTVILKQFYRGMACWLLSWSSFTAVWRTSHRMVVWQNPVLLKEIWIFM